MVPASFQFFWNTWTFPIVFGVPVLSDHSSVAGARSPQSLTLRDTNLYQATFGGNGEGTDWPSDKRWVPKYEDMFHSNMDVMTSSCPNTDAKPTTKGEAEQMRLIIREVADRNAIDPRVILAIVMQESNGCVRVPTTNNGVTNPGLMQSHDGKGSCNSGDKVEVPCQDKMIRLMIEDGTSHFKECMKEAGGSGAANIYKAARIYNSGSIDSSGDLGKGIGSSACYVSDLANRLLGWSTGESKCIDLASDLTGSSWGTEKSAGGPLPPVDSTIPNATTTPTVIPSVDFNSGLSVQVATDSPSAVSSVSLPPTDDVFRNPSIPDVPMPTQTPSPVKQGVEPATHSAMASSRPLNPPLYPNSIASCQKYSIIADGDSCIQISHTYGIHQWQLRSWNPGLHESCSNLWLGYQYCVKA